MSVKSQLPAFVKSVKQLSLYKHVVSRDGFGTAGIAPVKLFCAVTKTACVLSGPNVKCAEELQLLGLTEIDFYQVQHVVEDAWWYASCQLAVGYK